MHSQGCRSMRLRTRHLSMCTLVESLVLFVKDMWIQMFIFHSSRPMIPQPGRYDMLLIWIDRSFMTSVSTNLLSSQHTAHHEQVQSDLCASDSQTTSLPLDLMNSQSVQIQTCCYGTLELSCCAAVDNFLINQRR